MNFQVPISQPSSSPYPHFPQNHRLPHHLILKTTFFPIFPFPPLLKTFFFSIYLFSSFSKPSRPSPHFPHSHTTLFPIFSSSPFSKPPSPHFPHSQNHHLPIFPILKTTFFSISRFSSSLQNYSNRGWFRSIKTLVQC